MFYTGMAWGTDIICAEIVLQIKCLTDFHPKLICVIPFQKQYETWPESYQLRYKAILEQADELVRISDDFHKKCLWERNKYIIGQCGHLIAVYDGKSKGGTAEKIEMAKRKDAKIVVIDPFALND